MEIIATVNSFFLIVSFLYFTGGCYFYD